MTDKQRIAKLRKLLREVRAELRSQTRWANEYFRTAENLNAENKLMRKQLKIV